MHQQSFSSQEQVIVVCIAVSIFHFAARTQTRAPRPGSQAFGEERERRNGASRQITFDRNEQINCFSHAYESIWSVRCSSMENEWKWIALIWEARRAIVSRARLLRATESAYPRLCDNTNAIQPRQRRRNAHRRISPAENIAIIDNIFPFILQRYRLSAGSIQYPILYFTLTLTQCK